MKVFHALWMMAMVAGAQPAIAQQVQRTPQPRIANPNTATLAQRFPSIVAPSLQAQLRVPPAIRWRSSPIPPGILAQTTVNAIAQRINTALAGRSVGYSVSVRMGDNAVAEANGGFAIWSTVAGQARPWTGNDRITIASVSKSFTAAAIVRVAAMRSISLDTAAWTKLPSGWTFSAGFKTITIRELLSHNSGIRGCDITLEALQACATADIRIADKASTIPMDTKYNNANTAFLRLILSHLHDGSIPATAALQGFRYTFLVNQYVLGPAGVGSATCAPIAIRPARSYLSITDNMIANSTADRNYNWELLNQGTPWDDMTERCGSQGWFMSSRQLAGFAHALLFTDRVLPQTTVDQMRSGEMGLMFLDYGNGLTAFGHGGYHPGPTNNGEVNTLMLGYNNGISIGVVINSRFKGNFAQLIANAVREVVPQTTS